MKQATMKLTTIFTAFSLPLVALVTGAVTACAQEPYFKGKTIRIIVGFSPGGRYEVYTRAIARHMGKHIAGNPSVIVENMAGAASLISANHVYKVAKPEGITIGHFRVTDRSPLQTYANTSQ
jgi:tripartite-type tricarboxylate transporter receptor subunit TctC